MPLLDFDYVDEDGNAKKQYINTNHIVHIIEVKEGVKIRLTNDCYLIAKGYSIDDILQRIRRKEV